MTTISILRYQSAEDHFYSLNIHENSSVFSDISFWFSTQNRIGTTSKMSTENTESRHIVNKLA